MPTWADLYGDVYDIPESELPDGYLGDGPIYPDKIYKSGQIIGDEVISPGKQNKNNQGLSGQQLPENTSKNSKKLHEEVLMPGTQAKKKTTIVEQSAKPTKTQNKLFFGPNKASKRSNEI